VAVVILLGVLLQQPATPAAQDTVSVARVRKALEQPPAIETTRDVNRGGRPVFRLNVQGRKPEKPWTDWSGGVPSYVRPPAPPYHYDFLQQVTPEFFRASVLYPGVMGNPNMGYIPTVPIMPFVEAAAKGFKTMTRQMREARAREEVQKALEELERTRTGVIK
jgi:hypothetical protein